MPRMRPQSQLASEQLSVVRRTLPEAQRHFTAGARPRHHSARRAVDHRGIATEFVVAWQASSEKRKLRLHAPQSLSPTLTTSLGRESRFTSTELRLTATRPFTIKGFHHIKR